MLQWGLAAAGLDNCRFEARLLLARAAGLSIEQLIARGNEPASAAIDSRQRRWLVPRRAPARTLPGGRLARPEIHAARVRSKQPDPGRDRECATAGAIGITSASAASITVSLSGRGTSTAGDTQTATPEFAARPGLYAMARVDPPCRELAAMRRRRPPTPARCRARSTVRSTGPRLGPAARRASKRQLSNRLAAAPLQHHAGARRRSLQDRRSGGELRQSARFVLGDQGVDDLIEARGPSITSSSL